MKPRILRTALCLAMLAVAIFLQTAAAAATSYGGRAYVVDTTILGINNTLIDTGQLPSSGGIVEDSALDIELPSVLTAGIAHAVVVGQGNFSRAEASVSDLGLTVVGQVADALHISSNAEAKCNNKGKASVSGSSIVQDLAVNGQDYNITGRPNQIITLPLGLGQIIVNEQIKSVSGNSGSITVNALHITLLDDILGITVADIVIAHSEASITCEKGSGGGGDNGDNDFVTGCGVIKVTGGNADFVIAGGIKNDQLYGHLKFNDKANGIKVSDTTITNYEITGAKSRRLEGTATVNGQSGITFIVDVTDNGKGTKDTFRLQLSNGYDTGTQKLVKCCSNIKLH